ncbi:unnamed protein product, partial [Ectocarpus sp. 12 AP-2014]
MSGQCALSCYRRRRCCHDPLDHENDCHRIIPRWPAAALAQPAPSRPTSSIARGKKNGAGRTVTPYPTSSSFFTACSAISSSQYAVLSPPTQAPSVSFGTTRRPATAIVNASSSIVRARASPVSSSFPSSSKPPPRVTGATAALFPATDPSGRASWCSPLSVPPARRVSAETLAALPMRSPTLLFAVPRPRDSEAAALAFLIGYGRLLKAATRPGSDGDRSGGSS